MLSLILLPSPFSIMEEYISSSSSSYWESSDAMAVLSEEEAFHVLIIPFPTQGHMIPFFDLARHLSVRFRLAVTVAVTPANLHLLSYLLAAAPDVQPLVLPFPAHPSIPPGIEHAKGLPISCVRPFMHALSDLRAPLLRWARGTPNPPSAVISDFSLGWCHHLAADLGIPRLVFCPSGGLALSVLQSIWRRMPKRSDPDDEGEVFRFDDLPGSPAYPWRHLFYNYKIYAEGDPVSEFIKQEFLLNMKSWGYVFNSFEGLEGVYLDHLRTDLGHARVWAVGPLEPQASGGGASGRGGRNSVSEAEVAAWLDKWEAGTVVYACFGSQKLLSPVQVAALAAALERSGARFLWCVGETTSAPEEGFEERVAGRGRVIQGWAPQVAILSHPAVGSFVTHCGWNSIMEAVTAGVALLTWPMAAEQFLNAKQAVEELGIGEKACEGGPVAVPDPDELARVIADSVAEPLKKRREKALQLGSKAKEAVAQNGSSFIALQRMVEELLKTRDGGGGGEFIRSSRTL